MVMLSCSMESASEKSGSQRSTKFGASGRAGEVDAAVGAVVLVGRWFGRDGDVDAVVGAVVLVGRWFVEASSKFIEGGSLSLTKNAFTNPAWLPCSDGVSGGGTLSSLGTTSNRTGEGAPACLSIDVASVGVVRASSGSVLDDSMTRTRRWVVSEELALASPSPPISTALSTSLSSSLALSTALSSSPSPSLAPSTALSSSPSSSLALSHNGTSTFALALSSPSSSLALSTALTSSLALSHNGTSTFALALSSPSPSSSLDFTVSALAPHLLTLSLVSLETVSKTAKWPSPAREGSLSC